MIRNTLLTAFLAAALAAPFAADAAEPTRVAVVDMEKLLSEHPNTASDKALLQETLRDYEQEGEEARKKVEDLERLAEQAEEKSRSGALSDRARAEAAREAEEARKRWEEARENWMGKMRELQKLLSEQEMRMIRRTVSSLNTMIGDYAREQGYDLVLDASEKRLGSMPMVLYRHETLDITDALIRRLRAGAGETASAEAPAPAPADAE